MSNLTISNLEECRELDTEARADVAGGMDLPMMGYLPLHTLVASFNQAMVSQNGINLTMVTGDGGGNVIGNANITPVNIGSPVTILQGGLPA